MLARKFVETLYLTWPPHPTRLTLCAPRFLTVQTRATSLPSGTVTFLRCPTNPGSGRMPEAEGEEAEDEVRLMGDE